MTFTPPPPWQRPPPPTSDGGMTLSVTLASPVCPPAPYALHLRHGRQPVLAPVQSPFGVPPGTPSPLAPADAALLAACTAAAAADVAAAAAAVGGPVVLAAASAGAVPVVGAVVRAPAAWAGLLLVAPLVDLVGLVGGEPAGGGGGGQGEAAEWGAGPAVAAVCPTASLPLRGGTRAAGSDGDGGGGGGGGGDGSGGSPARRDADDTAWLAARPPVHITAGAADARVPAASVVRWVRAVAAAQARVGRPPAAAARGGGWPRLTLDLHPTAGHTGAGGGGVATDATEMAFVLACLGVPVRRLGGRGGEGGGGRAMR
ncbi:hypothetical protein I4F81_011664 [Pyropia yezoensis]|uniref:Uncharacterized protein n=1 Tax=Pyropia yezoensis TaxID=2788 RepID=A0ACC3CGG9_PYRYE|nr:hypothetical protein I4F81_011664 [Neopyropia yezoensis]